MRRAPPALERARGINIPDATWSTANAPKAAHTGTITPSAPRVGAETLLDAAGGEEQTGGDGREGQHDLPNARADRATRPPTRSAVGHSLQLRTGLPGTPGCCIAKCMFSAEILDSKLGLGPFGSILGEVLAPGLRTSTTRLYPPTPLGNPCV